MSKQYERKIELEHLTRFWESAHDSFMGLLFPRMAKEWGCDLCVESGKLVFGERVRKFYKVEYAQVPVCPFQPIQIAPH